MDKVISKPRDFESIAIAKIDKIDTSPKRKRKFIDEPRLMKYTNRRKYQKNSNSMTLRPFKFRTKDWVEIPDDEPGSYNTQTLTLNSKLRY